MDTENLQSQDVAQAISASTQETATTTSTAPTLMSESEFLKIMSGFTEKIDSLVKANQVLTEKLEAKENSAPKEVAKEEVKVPERMVQILKDAVSSSKPEEPLVAGTKRYLEEKANYASSVMKKIYGNDYIYRN